MPLQVLKERSVKLAIIYRKSRYLLLSNYGKIEDRKFFQLTKTYVWLNKGFALLFR